jgi:hypothetical protein
MPILLKPMSLLLVTMIFQYFAELSDRRGSLLLSIAVQFPRGKVPVICACRLKSEFRRWYEKEDSNVG